MNYPRHKFGELSQCRQPPGTVFMSEYEYRKEHDELIRLRELAGSPDAITLPVWREVLAHLEAEMFSLHDGCELDEPKDCALYDVIATEVTRTTGGKA